jgi:uncharacterized membrane protein YkoI
MLLPLVWLLMPAMGYFVVQKSTDVAQLVMAAQVPLTHAVRDAEAITSGTVTRAYIGSRRGWWGYVLVVQGQGGSQRLWVDPETGKIRAHGKGGLQRSLPASAMTLGALIEVAERRLGGRAMSADGTYLDGRPAIEVHVATADREVEVYLDVYTAETLVAVDERH